MNSLKNWTKALILPAMLGFVLSASAQSPQMPTNSAGGSPDSATNAERRKTKNDAALAACAAAADELAAARNLIELLEKNRQLLEARLETEKRIADLALQLAESRRLETMALRQAADAREETIAALAARIEAQEKMIADLKKRKTSVWKRLGDVMIGVAAGAILR